MESLPAVSAFTFHPIYDTAMNVPKGYAGFWLRISLDLTILLVDLATYQIQSALYSPLSSIEVNGKRTKCIGVLSTVCLK